MSPTHTLWKEQVVHPGVRHTFGLLVALALTLVAFEWRSDAAPSAQAATEWGLPIEEEAYPPVVLPPKQQKADPEPPGKKNAGGVPTVITDDPTPEPTNDKDTEASTEPQPTVDLAALLPPDTAGPGYVPPDFTPFPEVMPHFVTCTELEPEQRDECTRKLAQATIERRFRLPNGVRDNVRTTVTFEVGSDGTIGRIVCAPRVPAAVEREIARVIHSMPEFIPGSQGGRPVGVYFQIPLHIRVMP